MQSMYPNLCYGVACVETEYLTIIQLVYVCRAASLWGKPTATNEDIVPGLTLLNDAQGNFSQNGQSTKVTQLLAPYT